MDHQAEIPSFSLITLILEIVADDSRNPDPALIDTIGRCAVEALTAIV